MNNTNTIVLTAVRNEEWIIRLFLQAMSHIADHIIVADQRSTDRTRSICSEFPKVTLIDNDAPDFNEPERQAMLIQAARDFFPGKRLLLRFDVDEIPSGNLFDDPEWETLLEAPPGAPIQLQNVCLYDSPFEYRTDQSGMYGVSYLSYGMIDNNSSYSGPPIHTPRLPFRYNSDPIRLSKVVCMHYQFLDVQSALAKQRWYMCYERIHFPSKLPLEIINRYRWVMWDIHKWPSSLSPAEWLRGWEQRKVDLNNVVKLEHSRYVWEVLRLFKRHGEGTFADLPIWDFNWEAARKKGITERVQGLPEREVRDPRSQQAQIAHCLLREYNDARFDRSAVKPRIGELMCSLEPGADSGWTRQPDIQTEAELRKKFLIKTDFKIDMLPLVSIITPAYNRASYLDETIQSVLYQDYPRIEYIVLDDGSTDNTREVLDKYTERLTWETHPNMGETRTVNKGFGMAKGEIVCVVNSDDPLLPGAVSEAVAFMQAHPDILVAYPDWDMIEPNSKVRQHIHVPEYDYLYMLRRHHCTPGPGAFIRRKALELTKMRNPEYKYVADFEYWLRLGLYGKFARMPKTLATWRTHQNAATLSQKGTAMANEHIRLIQKFYSRPDLPLEVRRVRAEAYCWAYSEAAVCTTRRWRARQYLLKAVLHYPQGYLADPDRAVGLSRLVLPKPLYNLVTKLWHIARPILSRARRLIRLILKR